jgi:hypothetical protein
MSPHNLDLVKRPHSRFQLHIGWNERGAAVRRQHALGRAVKHVLDRNQRRAGGCLLVLVVAIILDRRPYRPGKLNY